MKHSPIRRSRQLGFGMIELMIALVLGVVVLGGALSLFASNRQAFRATEGLSRLQENARIGFEMMTRDVRDAAGTPCAKNIPMGNVVNGGPASWWLSFGNGIDGFDGAQALPGIAFGAAPAERVNGTDAIVLHSGGSSGASVIKHNPVSAQFDLNTSTHDFVAGDILLVCDYVQSTVMQMSGPMATNATVVHNTGTGSPGNCSKGLGFPTDCSSTIGKKYQYGPNSIIAKLNAVAWYIGNNARGGRSLYRKLASAAPDEIAEGVSDLQLTYLLPSKSAYADATNADVAAGWKDVNAVRIAFTAASTEKVGTGFVPLTRTVVEVAALRNRNE
jgi:type IV pilus assembly protein PilW